MPKAKKQWIVETTVAGHKITVPFKTKREAENYVKKLKAEEKRKKK